MSYLLHRVAQNWRDERAKEKAWQEEQKEKNKYSDYDKMKSELLNLEFDNIRKKEKIIKKYKK